MSNSFGADYIFQAPSPKDAARISVEKLGFEITDATPDLISLHGSHINISSVAQRGGTCSK